MANRNLSNEELLLANNLLAKVREEIERLAAGDTALLFAYRRKIAKELTYDERGKPMVRKLLKLRKLAEQKGLCVYCNEPLPEKYCVLDRLNALDGYTLENTQLIHSHCDVEIQAKRNYS